MKKEKRGGVRGREGGIKDYAITSTYMSVCIYYLAKLLANEESVI